MKVDIQLTAEFTMIEDDKEVWDAKDIFSYRGIDMSAGLFNDIACKFHECLETTDALIFRIYMYSKTQGISNAILVEAYNNIMMEKRDFIKVTVSKMFKNLGEL